MVLNLYILFIILPLAICFPFPSRDKYGKVQVTQLCDEIPLDEFFADMDQCIKEGNAPLDEAISAGQGPKQLQAAVCKTIGNKIQCIDTKGPKCLNSTQLGIFRTNIISDELDRSYNSTFLGPKFVRSCQILTQEETKIAEEMTGSTACSYTEYIEASSVLRACRDRAHRDRVYKMELIDFVSDRKSLYVNAMCTLKKDFGTCLTGLFICLGEQKKADLILDNNEYFDELEQIINNGTNSFSFKRSCGSIAITE